MHQQSGLVLEIPNANKDKGVPALLWRDHGATHQLWSIEPVDNDFVLKVKHSGQVLAIGQGLHTAKAPAMQWPFLPQILDQRWKLRLIDEGKDAKANQ